MQIKQHTHSETQNTNTHRHKQTLSQTHLDSPTAPSVSKDSSARQTPEHWYCADGPQVLIMDRLLPTDTPIIISSAGASLFLCPQDYFSLWMRNILRGSKISHPKLVSSKQVIDDHGEHVPNLSVHDTNLSDITPIKVGMIPIMVCMMLRANLRFKMQSWQQGLNWVVPSTHALWKDGFHPNGPRKRLSQAWLSDPLQKDYIQLNHPRAYPSYVDPLVQLLPIGCRCQYCSRSVLPKGYVFMILAFPKILQVWGVCW